MSLLVHMSQMCVCVPLSGGTCQGPAHISGAGGKGGDTTPSYMAAVRAAAAEAKPREGNQGGDVEGGVRRVEMLFGGSSFVCGLLQN
jgi:hypothetical protein